MTLTTTLHDLRRDIELDGSLNQLLDAITDLEQAVRELQVERDALALQVAHPDDTVRRLVTYLHMLGRHQDVELIIGGRTEPGIVGSAHEMLERVQKHAGELKRPIADYLAERMRAVAEILRPEAYS